MTAFFKIVTLVIAWCRIRNYRNALGSEDDLTMIRMTMDYNIEELENELGKVCRSKKRTLMV